MIFLLAATGISLAATQAAIAAPTNDFRACVRTAVTKATSDKVAGDAIEAYLKTACTAQMTPLKDALIAFRMKNGMTRKAAAADADMTIDDYVSTPADNYKFMATLNAPKAAATAGAKSATPAPTPAAVTQPPKP